MVLPAYPSGPVGIREWKVQMAQAVNTAANRGDNKCWTWMNKMMTSNVTWEELGNVKRKWRAIDQKLAHALTQQLPQGPLRLKVSSALRGSAESGAPPLTGVQILRLVLEEHRLTDDFNVHFAHRVLALACWQGDSPAAIYEYIDRTDLLFEPRAV